MKQNIIAGIVILVLVGCFAIYNILIQKEPAEYFITTGFGTYDNTIISIENNIIKPLKIGDTTLCIISQYDPNTSVCNNIEVTPICQNSYTFNFDGSKKEKIYAGIDFCPGTYRVYAQVLNPKDIYYIHHRQPNSASGSSSITIAKFSEFLSDEGNQWAMNKGSYIESNTGVTQITIVK